MNTIIRFSPKSVLRCFVLALTFLFLNATLSFAQEPKKNDKVTNPAEEWWIPILVKHKMDMKGSNNFDNIFEMGETNSVKDGICTLTNAFVILKEKSGNYSIIESPYLIHDFNKELIVTNSGTLKVYRKDSDPKEPITTIKILKMELTYPRK
jgi:hypothetical protein